MTGDRIIGNHAAQVALERKAYYDKIDTANCTPLWEVLHGLITATPNTPCLPFLWKWATVWRGSRRAQAFAVSSMPWLKARGAA